jgi:hypothetical protein
LGRVVAGRAVPVRMPFAMFASGVGPGAILMVVEQSARTMASVWKVMFVASQRRALGKVRVCVLALIMRRVSAPSSPRTWMGGKSPPARSMVMLSLPKEVRRMTSPVKAASGARKVLPATLAPGMAVKRGVLAVMRMSFVSRRTVKVWPLPSPPTMMLSLPSRTMSPGAVGAVLTTRVVVSRLTRPLRAWAVTGQAHCSRLSAAREGCLCPSLLRCYAGNRNA